MPLQLITPAAEEPVSLAEAKLHLRVESADDDALIGALISAARQAAETLTGRQFVTARWKLVLDSFPGSGRMILLPKCPVQSVFAIEYLDMAAASQTMPSAEYTVDTASEPGRITPVFGMSWPIALPQIGAVGVSFDAGYGLAANVPEGIKSWIRLRVGSLYAHREEVALLTRGSIAPLPFIDGLLDPYKVVTI